MILTGDKQITWRKPIPMRHYVLQVTHKLARRRTRVSTERGRLLIAWTLARA